MIIIISIETEGEREK